MKGEFILKNVSNLSHQAAIGHEISLLCKELSFGLTPEKLFCLQIETDLESVGGDKILRMYYMDNLTPVFSEAWTLPIRNIELDFQLLSTTESGKS